MINPDAVFVGHALPALTTPVTRMARVFGAASPLGEALLAQLLASPKYARVQVCTTALLPTTVAHLEGVMQGDAIDFASHSAVDCVLVVDTAPDNAPYNATTHASAATPVSRSYGFAARSPVYAPLYAEQVPALLAALSIAASAAAGTQHPALSLRWAIVAPHLPLSTLQQWVSTYCAHIPCMVYGVADGSSQGALRKTAYQFKPEGNTVLDRVGVWVLNLLSGTVHGMMNPQRNAPLTTVKTAQRLAARLLAWGSADVRPLSTLTAQDLAVV